MDEEHKARIREQMEAEHYLKHRRLEKVVKKSFIISQQEFGEESEVTNLMEKIKKKEIMARKLGTESYFSFFYFKYFMHKNPELASFLILQLNANILVHPIDTIKARIQARSIAGDICGFIKNKADKKSVYSGISYSYYLVALQAFAFTAVSKLTMVEFAGYEARKREYLNLLITDMISAPFKYYLDTKKMLLQLGNDKPSVSHVLRNYKSGFLALYLRDLVFKTLFFGVNGNKKDESNSPKNPLKTYILATLFTSVLSSPLDVVCTKLATQKDLYYKGFFDAISKVNFEEGTSKFLSGVSMRIVILTILGGINLYFYRETLEFMKEVYTLDNVIE